MVPEIPPPPFEPSSPAVYGAKVKDFLTALPLDDAELASLEADPKALRDLIDRWLTLPQYRQRIAAFFTEAFQQTQIGVDQFGDMFGNSPTAWPIRDRTGFLKSATESFSRTVMALIDEGRPFTEAVTTRRYMLNVPLMVALAYVDAAPLTDDNRRGASWLASKYPNFTATFTASTTGTARPLAEAIDPASATFMQFTFVPPMTGTCEDRTVTGAGALRNVFDMLFGRAPNCGQPQSEFSDADYQTWRMVTIRPPRPGEERTVFWDVPKLRDPATTELVLDSPRVGFLTTPAFFANWDTNKDNAFRVTANQSLIVGLATSFDPEDESVPVADGRIEGEHADPGTVCYGCHKTLDPMRDFFLQSYSVYYSPRTSPAPKGDLVPAATAVFSALGAPPVTGVGVPALAQAIAQHPAFAAAWTRKLCEFANFGQCLPDDPELLRVAQVWQDSGFRFPVLVRELFSSPLITFAGRTKTGEAVGGVVGIGMQDRFCRRWEQRFGLHDVCHLAGESALPLSGDRNTIRNLSVGLPSSGYARGDTTPVFPMDPNMFFAAGAEKICGLLAKHLVEGSELGRYRVDAKDAALDDFVATVMGAPPGHPDAPALRAILARHHDAAVAALTAAKVRTAAADALRSTFVLACSSAPAVSTGL